MSLFSSKTPSSECGIVIDIGSGSVGAAIVISDNDTNAMDIVWSHREYMLIKDEATLVQTVKDINTTIVNALLELGSNGMKTLHSFNPRLKPTHIQTALCAPWSYTVTKTINYEDEHPFEVSVEMLKELISTARKQTLATTLDGQVIKDLGLRMITDATVNVELNGYTIKDPTGQKSRSVSLSHIIALAQENILANLEDSIDRILPKAEVRHYSFMYLFYTVLEHLHPDTSEICLVDITNEATEIGIVRSNVLRHTTHAPVGLFSLARDIASACKIPKEEAFTFIKDGRELSSEKLGKEKEDAVAAIFQKYEDTVAELLTRTGDALSIPKTIFLHTSKHTEGFFSERLKNAAKKATASNHSIHPFTSEILGDTSIPDTALALSAHYFHMREVYAIVKD